MTPKVHTGDALVMVDHPSGRFLVLEPHEARILAAELIDAAKLVEAQLAAAVMKS